MLSMNSNFAAHRCGREGKCKFDPRIRQWKDKKRFGKKSKKSRYDKETFAWGLLYLTISYYGLKHVSLEELLGDGSQGMITRQATPSCQTRTRQTRTGSSWIIRHHITYLYITVPWQFRDVKMLNIDDYDESSPASQSNMGFEVVGSQPRMECSQHHAFFAADLSSTLWFGRIHQEMFMVSAYSSIIHHHLPWFTNVYHGLWWFTM